MPRIDPKTLIHCLHSLLNSDGGILGSPEVQRLITLMGKYSNTLVSKVCYVLILKATDDDLLVEWMADGGWELVFQWLGAAITNCNNPFIKELLQLLIKCPIRLDRLKESNAPRTVKGLSKESEDPGVRDLARQLVEMWLVFIKSGRAAVDPVHGEPGPACTASPSPPQPPKPKVSPVQPFKIIVRDGKRVLMSVGSDDSPPPKVKRVEKQSEIKIKNDLYKKSSESSSNVYKLNSDVIAMKAAISQSMSKTDQLDASKTEISAKEKKDKKDHKEHSRSSSSSSSHKFHKSSSHDKVKEHSREKSKDSSRDKFKDLMTKRKDSKEKSKDSKPRTSDKNSHRKSSSDKDDDDYPPKSAMPAISSLGKIPKKTSSSNVISAAEASASGGVLGAGKAELSPLPVAKKGTYSDERKRSSELKPSERPKTVKTLPTKFRSTGLEEEVKPPPSRSDIKKKEHAKDQSKRPSSSSKEDKDGSVPSEKKSKIDSNVIEIKEKLEKLSEKSGGIKLIAPKSNPVIVPIDLFFDALKDKDQKKKKRRSSSSAPSSSTKATEVKKEPGESSPKITKSSSPPKETSPLKEAKPLKFYRDTLDEPEPEVAEIKPFIPPKEIKEEKVPVSPRAKLFPEGVLVVHRSSLAPKKAVQWRNEADLVKIQFFELDETERVNVTRSNFVDLKAMERNREREAFLMHKMGIEDSGTSKMSWGPLFIVDVPPEKLPPEQGLHSIEKAVQHARQKTVLEAIFFNKAMIPDSPAEPDHESHPMTDPKPIPLDDASGGKDATFDYSSTPWPEPKTDIATNVNTAVPPPVVPTVVPFTAPGYASFPSYPVGVPAGAPVAETWRPSEEGTDVAALNYPNGVVPPIYGIAPSAMAPPYGPPPPTMMPPEGFSMGMFPPNQGFPMGPNPGMFGPGPPMGPMGPPPPGWGANPWNGPGGPPMLPLDTRNICRTWRKTGNCIRGSSCRFLHPGINCPPLPS